MCEILCLAPGTHHLILLGEGEERHKQRPEAEEEQLEEEEPDGLLRARDGVGLALLQPEEPRQRACAQNIIF